MPIEGMSQLETIQGIYLGMSVTVCLFLNLLDLSDLAFNTIAGSLSWTMTDQHVLDLLINPLD
jgi:hypothetical protein